MPFVNGRYHMNPTMGQALDAAREAEAAMLALRQRASGDSQDGDSEAQGSSSPTADDAPIHRIEIDATEVVPNATGRAARGFVARIHRTSAAPAATSSGAEYTPSSSSRLAAPESQVFTDHRDLLSFLQNVLAQK
jgi:hypothetical protein